MKPSAKNKGRQFEHEVATAMGGKRTPRSGAIGGMLAADVSFADESIYAPLHIEAKRRAAIPSYVTVAYNQAKAACSALKSPAIVLRQDRGEPFIFMRLDEFVTFTKALAETGQGHRIRSLVRDAENILRQIREAS